MVVAIRGETVYLGGDMEVHVDKLTNSDSWSLIAHVPL